MSKLLMVFIFLTCSLADAMIPSTKGQNAFCEFEPYNHPVLSFSQFDELKALETKKQRRKYLTNHMLKQCGYVPKGSVK